MSCRHNLNVDMLHVAYDDCEKISEMLKACRWWNSQNMPHPANLQNCCMTPETLWIMVYKQLFIDIGISPRVLFIWGC